MLSPIRQILNKPDAPLILQELNDILMKEVEKRKAFREWIDDSMKAEFIKLSSRTATRDKGIKKQDYAAHGVREYWIIDAERQEVAQYFLLEGEIAYMEPYRYIIDDEIESRVIKGFRIPVRAIFDEQANVLALQGLVGK